MSFSGIPKTGSSPTGKQPFSAVMVQSRQFQRLAGVTAYRPILGSTSIFFSRQNHNYRVADVAINLGRAYNLDLEKVKIIVLSHDLGILPFAHIVMKKAAQFFPEGKFDQGRYNVEALQEIAQEHGCSLDSDLINDVSGMKKDKFLLARDGKPLFKRSFEGWCSYVSDVVVGWLEDGLIAGQERLIQPQDVPSIFFELFNIDYTELLAKASSDSERFDLAIIETALGFLSRNLVWGTMAFEGASQPTLEIDPTVYAKAIDEYRKGFLFPRVFQPKDQLQEEGKIQRFFGRVIEDLMAQSGQTGQAAEEYAIRQLISMKEAEVWSRFAENHPQLNTPENRPTVLGDPILSRERIEDVRQAFRETVEDDNLAGVIVYGSTAKGEARPDSDIDLMLIKRKPTETDPPLGGSPMDFVFVAHLAGASRAKLENQVMPLFLSDPSIPLRVFFIPVHLQKDMQAFGLRQPGQALIEHFEVIARTTEEEQQIRGLIEQKKAEIIGS